MVNKTPSKPTSSRLAWSNKPAQGLIKKKLHEIKGSRILKKSKEFMKGVAIMSGRKITVCEPEGTAVPDNLHLPGEDTDNEPHQALSINISVNALSSYYFSDTIPEIIHADHLPRTWKESIEYNVDILERLSPKDIKCQEILYEIILTEQIYVDDLVLIYKVFIEDCLKWAGLCDLLKCFFTNLSEILHVHLDLLKEFKCYQADSYPMLYSITPIFDSFKEKLQLYTNYLTNYEKVTHIITTSIQDQDELGKFISRRSLWKEFKSLPLTSYLLKPMQRIMKYPLFFKSLSDCLPIFHYDKPGVEYTLNALDNMLKYFEEKQEEAETLAKMESLASRIEGLEEKRINLVEPGRRLIYEGYLKLIPTTKKSLSPIPSDSDISMATSSFNIPALRRKGSSFSIKKKKDFRAYVFLFNNLIICTKVCSKKKSRERGSLPKKKSCYGISPNTRFKLLHTPGRLTIINRAVSKEIIPPLEKKKLKEWLKLVKDSTRNTCKIIDSPKAYKDQPLQFTCSIATTNLTNFHFEADNSYDKMAWCDYLESVLDEHLCRPQILDPGAASPAYSFSSFSTVSSDSNSYCSSLRNTLDYQSMELDQPSFCTTVPWQEEEMSIGELCKSFSGDMWHLEHSAIPITDIQLSFSDIDA
ncbi:Dbl homology domain-containing protein [Pilobolus umbonatus]|nr:Dbl homology domain-containing protein [Pilobolus umbonatus]